MNHITSLMLARSIQQDRLDAADHRHRDSASPVKPERPERRSFWGEMLRVYQLGFATKP